MVDRVRPLKFENPATGGTETDLEPTEANPAEDFLDASGITIQNATSSDDTVRIGRDAADNMTFQDGIVAGTKTLTDLLVGETNTASNVGTSGIGVFKQKTGVDLEFKKLASVGTIDVVDDVGNSRILLDVALDALGLNDDDRVGFYDRTETSLSFVDATRTLTISPTGADFSFFIDGAKRTRSSPESIVIPNSSNLHFVYYVPATALLFTGTTPWDLAVDVPVCLVYWNASTGEGLVFDERHTVNMPWRTHEYLHGTRGTAYQNGLGLTGYTLDTDTDAAVTVGIGAGQINDEDIPISITHEAVPATVFSQVLNDPAEVLRWWRQGTGSANWYWDGPDQFFMKNAPAGRVYYNLDTGGTWSLQEVANSRFVAYFIAATDLYLNPVVSIMGQREDTSLSDALENNAWADLDFGSFPAVEVKPIYMVILSTSTGAGNTPKCRIRAVLDLRSSGQAGAGTFTPTNHQSLGGRSVAGQHPSSAVTVDNTLYAGILAAATDAQLAFDAIDAAAIGQTNTVVGSSGITNVGTNVDADLAPTYGTAANTICQGNDSRLFDSRTPTGTASGDLGGTYPSPTVNDGADSTAIHDNVAAEISAITEKATPVSADLLLLEDSEAGNAKRRVQVGNLPGGAGGGQTNTVAGSNGITNTGDNVDAVLAPTFGTSANTICQGNDPRLSDDRNDADAIHDNVAAEISAVTEKTTPVAADLLLIEDSAAGNAKKRIQIGNLPGNGDLPTAFVRETGEPAFTTTPSSATFNTTIFETDTSVVEHDNTNTDRINVKENGLYQVGISFAKTDLVFGQFIWLRTTLNGTTTIEGGTTAAVDVGVIVSHVFVVELTAGDYITLEGQSTSGSQKVSFLQMYVTRLRGAKGAKGDKGDQGDPGVGGQTNTVVGSSGITNVGTNVDADLAPTYGTSANTICQGNDSRLSDSRAPTGTASGDLGGTYPSPTVNDGADSTAIHDNVAAEISAITEKATPITGDWLLIEDGAAANAKKRVNYGNLKATDTNAIHVGVAAEISTITEKVTPVSADLIVIEDSAAGNAKKRVQIGNLPGGGTGGQTNTVVGSSGITNVGDNVDADLAPTYGTSANTICQGNDSRLSDSRTPTGSAGGDVGGTYPSSLTVTDLTIASEAQGDILYFNGTNWVRLAPGTSGYFLKTNGPAANPVWAAGGGGSAPPSYIAEIATLTSASPTSYTLISGMTLTPAAGTYLVGFNAMISHSSNATSSNLAIFSGGTVVSTSVRSPSPYRSGQPAAVATSARVTVNGSQAIQVRWHSSGQTLSMVGRTLTLVQVS